MISKRKTRIIFILTFMIVTAGVVGLVLYALRQNINLYYTPQQIFELNAVPTTRIRLGGLVRKDSIQYLDDLQIKFIVTDLQKEIQVNYAGILPDLFREEQGVVVLGSLTSENVFKADQVLAKHDENYKPPMPNHESSK